MLESILINVCVTVTFGFVASLTVGSVTRPATRTELALRVLLAATGAITLMNFPARFGDGVIFDLRNLAIVAITLAHGPLAGMIAVAPAVAYRAALGGAGVTPGIVSLLAAVALAAAARRRIDPFGPHPWRNAWLLLAALGVPPLSILMVPGGASVLSHAYAPLMIGSASSFALLVTAIRSRLRLLELAADYEVLAHRAALTGLANRRQFELDLRRLKSTDHLLVLDIDHFKHVNDAFGHAVGDRVLAAAASIVTGAIRARAGDRAYRLGGEEFAVVIAACPSDRALVIAERIRAAMPGGVARHVTELPDGVTVSGGLVLVGDGEPRERLAAADTLMYAAKQLGRDRIVPEGDSAALDAALVRRTMILPPAAVAADDSHA